EPESSECGANDSVFPPITSSEKFPEAKRFRIEKFLVCFP
ncbi:hypothetical protein AVEN_96535-2-1, partial [Araneus ventricosus]